jgi:hypothetical protein
MRFRRKLLLLIVLVCTLALLLAAVVQVVLWSDVPRQLVLAELEQELGMQVEATVLRTGWRGHTQIENLTLTLPLADRPFVEVPRADVRHTGPISLVLGRSLRVRSIELDAPRITIEEDEQGRWNVALAAELLSGEESGEASSSSVSPWPDVTARGAVVSIEPSRRAAVTLDRIDVTGRMKPGMTYTLDLVSPEVGTLLLQAGLASPSPQVGTFDLVLSPALLHAAADIEGLSQSVRAQGKWDGRLVDGQLRGTVAIGELDASAVRIHGRIALHVDLAGDEIALMPQGLYVEAAGTSESLQLTGGRVISRGAHLHVDALTARGYDGQAVIDGELDLATLHGEGQVRWQSLQWPAGWRHLGLARLAIKPGLPGRRVVEAAFEHETAAPLGTWRFAGRLDAQGTSPAQATAALTLDEVRFTRAGRTYTMPGLLARATIEGGHIDLHDLSLYGEKADAALSGRGLWRLDESEWSLQLTGHSLPLPLSAPVLEALRLRIDGDAAGAALSELHMVAAGYELTADGRFEHGREEPVTLSVLVTRAGEAMRGDRLRATLQAKGSLSPLKLAAQGRLQARDLRWRGADLGDVAAGLIASADEHRVSLQAAGIESFGGRVEVDTVLDLQRERLDIAARGDTLQLTMLARLVPELAGLTGEVDATIEGGMPLAEPGRFAAAGAFAATEVALPPLQLDRVAGRLDVRADRLRIDEIEGVRGDGRVRGWFELPADPRQLWETQITLTAWPWPIVPELGVAALVDGEVRLSIAPDTLAVRGPGRIDVAVDARDDRIAKIAAGLRFVGDTVEAMEINGHVLDGPLAGQARVNLRDPRLSTAVLQWTDVDLQQGVAWSDQLDPLTGSAAVTLTMRQDDSSRSLARTRIDLDGRFTDTTFGQIPLSMISGTMYLDAQRTVLESLDLLSPVGVVRVQGRLSDRGPRRFAFLTLAADAVDLEPVTLTFRPDRPPVLGRLTADANVHVELGRWRSAAGRGSASIRDSDLASIPVFASLWNLMNLRLDLRTRHPEGNGQATFRVEDGVLIFDRIAYSNRGLYAVLAGRMENIWAGGDSPVAGTALLSLKPLPDLVVFQPINELFATIQADATFVEVDGTVDQPQTNVVPLRSVREGLTRMLRPRSRYPATPPAEEPLPPPPPAAP